MNMSTFDGQDAPPAGAPGDVLQIHRLPDGTWAEICVSSNGFGKHMRWLSEAEVVQRGLVDDPSQGSASEHQFPPAPMDLDDSMNVDDSGMPGPSAPAYGDVLRAFFANQAQDPNDAHAAPVLMQVAAPRGAAWIPPTRHESLATNPVNDAESGDLMRTILNAKIASSSSNSPALRFNPFSHFPAAGERRGSTGLTGTAPSTLTSLDSQGDFGVEGGVGVEGDVEAVGDGEASDAGTLILPEPVDMFPKVKRERFPKAWYAVAMADKKEARLEEKQARLAEKKAQMEEKKARVAEEKARVAEEKARVAEEKKARIAEERQARLAAKAAR